MSPVSVEAVMKRLTFFLEKRYLGICASGKQQSLSSTSQPEQRSGILIVFFFPHRLCNSSDGSPVWRKALDLLKDEDKRHNKLKTGPRLRLRCKSSLFLLTRSFLSVMWRWRLASPPAGTSLWLRPLQALH